MGIDRIDHLVLTVASAEATCDFYTRALGMAVERFRGDDGADRLALKFGNAKINLHVAGAEFEPRARKALPGTGDFCLIVEGPLEPLIEHLDSIGIPVELGPVARAGAKGAMTSIYLRDPDGNLVEVATYG
jgi:catechol 2,3-dioxygenase-like lactoylglutathione lyase family enzyme